jgi:hypothetical protein
MNNVLNLLFLVIGGPGVIIVSMLAGLGFNLDRKAGGFQLWSLIFGLAFWVLAIPGAIYLWNHTTFTP